MVCRPEIKIIIVVPRLAQICTTMTQMNASPGWPPRNSDWRPNQPKMVDIGGKADTLREAVARGRVSMQPATFKLIKQGGTAKIERYIEA